MRVIWSAEARAQLQAIRTFIAEHSPDDAAKLVQRIIARQAQIGALPYSGREVPEYRQEDVREVLQRPYRIIYRIETDCVVIITVWHVRRLLPDTMNQL